MHRECEPAPKVDPWRGGRNLLICHHSGALGGVTIGADVYPAEVMNFASEVHHSMPIG
jgi:hypothetical protein